MPFTLPVEAQLGTAAIVSNMSTINERQTERDLSNAHERLGRKHSDETGKASTNATRFEKKGHFYRLVTFQA